MPDGSTFQAPTRFIPTAAAIARVREFTARALELNAYVRRADVAAERRNTLGIEPPPLLRAPTEAEVEQEALALDAGAPFNPRLWQERLTVREQKAAA